MEKMYTVKEVANLIGMAEVTVRQWIQHEKVESVKIGSMRRIPQSEVERLQKGE